MAGTWVIQSLRSLLSDLTYTVNGGVDPDIADGFLWRIEVIYRELAAMEVIGVLQAGERAALEDVTQAYHKMSRIVDKCGCCSPSQAPIVQAGNIGRPNFEIPNQQLQYLIQNRFSVPQIAKIVGVSISTIRRRMSEFNLSIRETYSSISDSDLDAMTAQVQQEFPTWGNRQMYGYFVSRGIRLQYQRIRESQRRVDPEGSILRQLHNLTRRRYSVPGPQSLWHMDGNHKLIRYIPT